MENENLQINHRKTKNEPNRAGEKETKRTFSTGRVKQAMATAATTRIRKATPRAIGKACLRRDSERNRSNRSSVRASEGDRSPIYLGPCAASAMIKGFWIRREKVKGVFRNVICTRIVSLSLCLYFSNLLFYSLFFFNKYNFLFI